jgi:16S rRNA (guanine966-N2)-methyltransferase
LRIIGGTAKGRKLLELPRKGLLAKSVRPTSARAREAVFNIIAPLVADADILDLFAGTGAMGIEALSRGSRSAVFIDKSPTAVKLISRNLDLCGFSCQGKVLQRDLMQKSIPESIIPPPGFSLVFVDPPYGLAAPGKVFELLGVNGVLASGGLVVFEYKADGRLPEVNGTLQLHDIRRYGAAGFWFYHEVEVKHV